MWGGVRAERTIVCRSAGRQREASCASSILGQGKSISVKVRVSFTSERLLVLGTDRNVKHGFVGWLLGLVRDPYLSLVDLSEEQQGISSLFLYNILTK